MEELILKGGETMMKGSLSICLLGVCRFSIYLVVINDIAHENGGSIEIAREMHAC